MERHCYTKLQDSNNSLLFIIHSRKDRPLDLLGCNIARVKVFTPPNMC